MRFSKKSNDWILIQFEDGEISTSAVEEIFRLLENTRDFSVAYGDIDSETLGPQFFPNWNLRFFVGHNCLRGVLLFSKEKLIRLIANKKLASWSEFLAMLAFDFRDDDFFHISKILFHASSGDSPHTENIFETP